MARHLGVVLDLPMIGGSTSLPLGVALEPAAQAGAWSPLRDGAEVIRGAVCTRPGSRPVYISSGHRISLASAIRIMLDTSRGHRQRKSFRLAVRLAAEKQS